MNAQDREAKMRERLEGRFPHPGPKDAMMYLVSEVGEATDALLRLMNPGDKRNTSRPTQYHQVLAHLADELGDVQMMLCTVANHFNIDLEACCAYSCRDKERKYGVEGSSMAEPAQGSGSTATTEG